MKPTKTERIFIRVTAEQKARYADLAFDREETLSELIIELLDREVKFNRHALIKLPVAGFDECIQELEKLTLIK